jgi:hypothetical protein
MLYLMTAGVDIVLFSIFNVPCTEGDCGITSL